MAKIAFIGLGRMGLGMATRLLMVGHTVKVYNRTPAKADPVVRVGAHLAATPQVVRNTRRMVDGNHDCDVVFTPALRLKDIRYGLGLARKLGLGSPFGALAGGAFQQLLDLGHAHMNESKILEVSRIQPAAER